jgi:DNA-binding NarL/FixJ family response regulator
MSSAPSPIHVWIIEDDLSFRETMEDLLERTADLALGQSFGAVEEALGWIDDAEAQDEAWTRPDVLLLDINLPGMTGIDGIGDIKARLPETGVIMLTIRDEAASIFEAFRAGASGYLLKNSPIDRIIAAIREASTGGMLMPSPVARKVLQFFQQPKPTASYRLTGREQEVLGEMVNGRTQKEIADALFVSPSTVNTHVRHIYKKLHVRSSTEAVAKALRERLVDDLQSPNMLGR